MEGTVNSGRHCLRADCAERWGLARPPLARDRFDPPEVFAKMPAPYYHIKGGGGSGNAVRRIAALLKPLNEVVHIKSTLGTHGVEPFWTYPGAKGPLCGRSECSLCDLSVLCFRIADWVGPYLKSSALWS